MDSTVATANRVAQWADDYHEEYVRDSRFKRYMGKDTNKVFQVIEDLTKKDGDRITVSLVTKLEGDGVENDDTLEGNEEELGNFGHRLTVNQRRNGVRVGKHEQIKSKIGLLNAAKPQLKTWSGSKLRDDQIRALCSPHLNGKTAYPSCTEAQKDAWLAANSDRVLFGAAKANNASNDHSAALLQIDGTADDLSPEMVSLAKRMAQTADRHIRPIRVGEDEEWFVLFVGSLMFRDLKLNMSTVHQNAGVRGKENPLFRDGDLMWDGVIIREIPEMTTIAGVGTGGIDVGIGALCGAQAVGIAWAERSHFEMDEFDYKNKRGVAIAETLGVEKLMFCEDPENEDTEARVQHGMVTVYASAVADG
jgi:N4-gp56 family major capsid protein